MSDTINDWMNTEIFGLPRDQALHNAFTLMGLNSNASNDAINRQFRALCLKYHPDKGGDSDSFNKLQIAMTVIRNSRGYYENT